MIARLVSAFFCLCALAVHSQPIETRFGSLRVLWPQGFSLKSAQPPFELSGPAGAKVLVSVFRMDQRAPDKPLPSQNDLSASGERMLQANAEKAGTLVLPLQRTFLPDGSVLLFAGSSTGSLLSTGYFLQYALVSPHSRLAYITVEGKGDVRVEHPKYLPAFQTVEWEK